jgi:hypothetical protein
MELFKPPFDVVEPLADVSFVVLEPGNFFLFTHGLHALATGATAHMMLITSGRRRRMRRAVLVVAVMFHVMWHNDHLLHFKRHVDIFSIAQDSAPE